MVKGKSSVEKKEKMMRAMEKKRLRDKKSGSKKRKLHPMGEDLSDYSDDDVEDVGGGVGVSCGMPSNEHMHLSEVYRVLVRASSHYPV